jgi:signal transduction histidine kinase
VRDLAHTLRRRQKIVALFVFMVLLPAAVFTVLIVRGMRSERLRVADENAQRRRQIVRLVEADLKNWLFSPAPGGAHDQALLSFEVRGDRMVFPEFGLSLSAQESPQQRPFDVGPPEGRPTRESIAEQYFPRIEAFRRDLGLGRNAGAQYFPRLRAIIIQAPGASQGYVVDVGTVLAHVNARLAEFAGPESASGTVWIREARTSQPPANGFALEGFSFFEVTFDEAPSGAAAWLRGQAFPYSMSLLVLVTVLGSVFVYRAISHETRLTRLRSDFVAAVSHEFRSPLSSILALSERLERIHDPERLTEYHRIIRKDAQRLSALVARLLDFALIEDGRKVYARERVDLSAAAREAIDACRDAARPDRIRLLGAGDQPRWVEADPTALHHALQNIIENAAKYSPSDAPIEVQCHSVNGSHAVDVQDRGIGIPAADQARIFEKFYRGPGVSALNVQGVGIGLALVRHVVDSHGGSIDVVSQPGEGSRFSLRLPKAEG